MTSDSVVPTSSSSPVQVLVVSGLSGSGKSVALRTLEDLDYYCADNLPAELLPQFVESVVDGAQDAHRIAVGIDVRNRPQDLADLPRSLAALGSAGFGYRLVFLDTRDEVLIKRFNETRRRHPLSRNGLPLAEAIARERELMRPLAALADVVIDSSELNVHQLRRKIATEIASGGEGGLSILLESFAYKNGLPADADFVFDVRCLPNPHWLPALRPLSGRDQAVREHLDEQPLVRDYLDQVIGFLDSFLPRFENDSRSYVTVAFGCTGGRHRSVYCAETVAAHLRAHGREQVVTFHREIE
ncbi:RNase adapter RapZ [uncultured Aquimonas sp.]|uniref:RNase adapter RapZ n=1 Tax=uncultured Aquimonas sp. TaxID=385483 RepID=UPI00086C4DFB|nr:RNase adapter RapZ [uncultured Aquimonas sp.]ODU41252.1 MAG: RNase adaptor protein RapZ [Xanthomonadaceae bacterium SCN 69-123]